MPYVIRVTETKEGGFEHLLEASRNGKLLRCYCDMSLPVRQKNTRTVPLGSTLTCKVCEERRKTWAGFHAMQEQLHPDAPKS
jgi:hypothetical protein